MGRKRGRHRVKRPNQQARRLAQQHVKLDKRYTAVCKHWKRGHCRQGRKCNFAHPGDPHHPALRLIGVPNEFKLVENNDMYVKQPNYSDPVMVSNNGQMAVTVQAVRDPQWQCEDSSLPPLPCSPREEWDLDYREGETERCWAREDDAEERAWVSRRQNEGVEEVPPGLLDLGDCEEEEGTDREESHIFLLF